MRIFVIAVAGYFECKRFIGFGEMLVFESEKGNISKLMMSVNRKR